MFITALIAMSTLSEMKELLDLSAQMGHKDKGLKRFVPEEQARMCDEREKERFERQTDKDRVFQLQFC